jgi:hypothetical protein
VRAKCVREGGYHSTQGESYAAELDRIIGAGISGVNNKEVWIEEFDDE